MRACSVNIISAYKSGSTMKMNTSVLLRFTYLQTRVQYVY